MLAKAIAFAAKAHENQIDKQGAPYILHTLRIALALRQDAWSEIYQVAAVLHDTVEDTETTLEEIYEAFGDEVGGAVDSLTRRGHWEPHPDQEEAKWVWDETYKEYIRRCCQNSVARVVKKYDVYDNADPRRYCEGVPIGRYTWTLEYLRELEAQEGAS